MPVLSYIAIAIAIAIDIRTTDILRRLYLYLQYHSYIIMGLCKGELAIMPAIYNLTRARVNI